jgi:hypothetical protein
MKKKMTSTRSYGIVHVPRIKNNMWSLYERLIAFCVKYKSDNSVGFHRDYNALNCYSNNLDILQELLDIDNSLEVYEVVMPPPETMYFSKEPKYAYRVYIKSTKAPEQLLETLREFRNAQEKLDTVEFSPSFKQWIDRTPKYSIWGNRYLHNGFFINYKDPSMLTYMHLMFNECLGKNYKLEKRPE